MEQAAGVVLRRAGVDDLDELIRVTDEGRAALGALGIDQWQGGTPTPQTLRDDVAAGNSWLAVDAAGGEVLGCMAFCLGGEPDYDNIVEGAWLVDSPNVIMGDRSRQSPSDAADEDPSRAVAPTDALATPVQAGTPSYACVHRVAVAAAARRRGVASMLFSEAKRMAADLGLASVRVDTHPGNLPMQRSLERAGFVRCCTILITLPEEPTKERIGYEFVL